MLGFYVFAAVLGGGLLLLSQLAGDHGNGGAGDHGDASDFGAHGPAELLLGFFRPRNFIFFLAAFGITGTLLTVTGGAAPATLGLSALMGVLAMALTHGVFTWLRRSDTATDTVADADLEGGVGRVVLPVRPGERGRIACVVGDQEMHVTARLMEGAHEALELGREVVVIRMIDGEAEVSALEPPPLPPASM
jgi:membrane protein implicated in regulation of membrane protease activity